MRYRSVESIESIITHLLGPHATRPGDHSGRLFWSCPFHEDRNHNLCIQPGTTRYRCLICGASGDVIDFLRATNPGFSTREAGRAIQRIPSEAPAGGLGRSPARSANERFERPANWQDFGSKLITKAETDLWSEDGQEARRMLAARGLSDETIRGARLGFHCRDEWIPGVYVDRKLFVPAGLIIPWMAGTEVQLINVRCAQGRSQIPCNSRQPPRRTLPGRNRDPRA